MSKYKTEPIDYTGCHPVIAEHLKRGEMILCDTGTGNFWIDGFGNKNYLSDDSSFAHATPIEHTRYVKKASDIVKWLEDNGYEPDSFGDWIKPECVSFVASTWVCCGKDVPSESEIDFLPEWLEYVEVGK